MAIGINLDYPPAKNNKANALANIGNFDEAIILYNAILKDDPGHLTAQKNLEMALKS